MALGADPSRENDSHNSTSMLILQQIHNDSEIVHDISTMILQQILELETNFRK